MTKRVGIGGAVEDQEQTLKHGGAVTCLMDLPPSVLHEILSRLPIKLIMKLKHVCTSMYKLISHPDFTLHYTKFSHFSTLLIRSKPKYRPFTFVECFDMHEFSDNNHECFQTTLTPKIPHWREKASSFYLVGSCNGLVCLSLRSRRFEIVYMCTPINGDCNKELPRLRIKNGQACNAIYGFGFCSYVNKYKVMRISRDCENKYSTAEIFTVGGDDRWRRLVNPSISISNWFENFVALNGFFHWIVNDDNSTWISTFDLGEEKIGRLSQPHGLVLNCRGMRLESINNQLYLLDNSGPLIIVWKMKEYGVAESWTKDIILDISSTSMSRSRKLIVPVAVLKNGDILFYAHWGQHFLYNPIMREFTRIRRSNNYGSFTDYGTFTFTYAPSLLSLEEAVMKSSN